MRLRGSLIFTCLMSCQNCEARESAREARAWNWWGRFLCFSVDASTGLLNVIHPFFREGLMEEEEGLELLCAYLCLTVVRSGWRGLVSARNAVRYGAGEQARGQGSKGGSVERRFSLWSLRCRDSTPLVCCLMHSSIYPWEQLHSTAQILPRLSCATAHLHFIHYIMFLVNFSISIYVCGRRVPKRKYSSVFHFLDTRVLPEVRTRDLCLTQCFTKDYRGIHRCAMVQILC